MTKTNLKRQVAQNIKKARTKRGLTQEAAAELSGFHYKYYQRIESGLVNLTLDSLGKLATAFKVKASNFLDK
ncbi:helix-turn-helix domain-containing protein [bacterium]|nr:helix-turn-helix domain-containing protein [bacterium]